MVGGWDFTKGRADAFDPGPASPHTAADVSARLPALIDAVAYWIALDASTDALRSERTGLFEMTAPLQLGHGAAWDLPGIDPVERMDLLGAVLDELGRLLGDDHADTALLQPALATRAGRLSSYLNDHEFASWEALLDAPSLDAVSLDAFYETLARPAAGKPGRR